MGKCMEILKIAKHLNVSSDRQTLVAVWYSQVGMVFSKVTASNTFNFFFLVTVRKHLFSFTLRLNDLCNYVLCSSFFLNLFMDLKVQ